MLKKNQKGFSVVELLIVIVVIGLLGFVGYKVMQSRKSEPAKSTSSPSSTVATSKKWQEGDFAVAGTYADADIVQISANKWRLYYSIQPEVQGNQFEVYSSTSTDGKKWTKEAGTRKTMATFPDVVKTSDGKYRMYFQQASVIKSAISSDGLTFTDESGTRIDKSNNSGLTFDNVAAPTVILKSDNTYMMVYRGTINTRYAADTPNATTQLLMWATSTDGLTFTKKGIAIDSRNATLQGQLDGPDLVKWDDGKLHVFATTYSGVFEFIFDGDSFDKGEMAYTTVSTATPQNNTPPAAVAPPGDPTLAKIGGTWFMYYGGSKDKNGIRYATLQ